MASVVRLTIRAKRGTCYTLKQRLHSENCDVDTWGPPSIWNWRSRIASHTASPTPSTVWRQRRGLRGVLCVVCCVLCVVCCGVAVLRCCGVAVLRCCGVAVLRCCGVAVLRCCGVAVLRCCVLCVVCCVLCVVCCVLCVVCCVVCVWRGLARRKNLRV